MTLADRVDLPIVLYNIPGRTNVTMSAQTVARLNAHKNIVAIKESTGSLDMATEIMSVCDITVVSGDDALALPLMSIGAKGVISVASNLIPGEVKKADDGRRGRRLRRRGQQHHRLFPLVKSLFLDGNPVGVKYAMTLLGLDSGELRLPLWEASEATKQAIRSEMEKLGLRAT
jgi:4-hydroxy-tetrahydrodipicolinate synthase